MTCRECGDEVRELYSCRICEGSGLCMECAVLCEDELPFTAIVTGPDDDVYRGEGDLEC